MNAMPTFSPLPTKLKPDIANTPSTSGSVRMIFADLVHHRIGALRCVAPGGNETIVSA